MEIIVAKHMGFCSGVAKAVDAAYKMADNLDNTGDLVKCSTLGPLIHNRQVTDDLAQKGIGIINNLDEWQGERIIIRAHGIPPVLEKEIISKGIPYIDMTCPRVKDIHRRAAESKKEKRILIVLGSASHPEVVGTLGYGGPDSIAAEDAASLCKLDPNLRYTMVVQTTYKRETFEEAKLVLHNMGIDVVIHNTICDATLKRQQEAVRISKIVDVMLVLGDQDSANSRNLYEISQKNCPRAIFIQSIHDIQLQDLSIGDRIGLTAGASTPPSVTKEALFSMNDLEMNMNSNTDSNMNSDNSELIMNNTNTQDSETQSTQTFEEMLNESFVTLHTGDVVKGTVIQVTSGEVTVNLGYKSDGIITKSEFTDDVNADLTTQVNPGDVLEVLVMRVNDGDGNVLVSKRRLEAQTNYKLIEQAFNEKASVTGRIQDLVKGGLIANIFGNRVFVPSSQISNRYVDDLAVFKGKELSFNILEFDRSKRRIVAGRRDLAAQEQKVRREELFASLEVGQKLEGTVSRITDFGAFVDLGGVDGLIHISELAWRRVRKVSDVLSAGESVVVTVIDINPEKNKISLSLKDINNNPWNNVAEKYPIGKLIEGSVVRMAPFGAFVNLEDGVDGLVHVSQIADKHVAKPDDELSVGQVITVKVTDVDEENKKISLSKKLADAELAGEGEDYGYDDDDYYDYDDESDRDASEEGGSGEARSEEDGSDEGRPEVDRSEENSSEGNSSEENRTGGDISEDTFEGDKTE